MMQPVSTLFYQSNSQSGSQPGFTEVSDLLGLEDFADFDDDDLMEYFTAAGAQSTQPQSTAELPTQNTATPKVSDDSLLAVNIHHRTPNGRHLQDTIAQQAREKGVSFAQASWPVVCSLSLSFRQNACTMFLVNKNTLLNPLPNEQSEPIDQSIDQSDNLPSDLPVYPDRSIEQSSEDGPGIFETKNPIFETENLNFETKRGIFETSPSSNNEAAMTMVAQKTDPPASPSQEEDLWQEWDESGSDIDWLWQENQSSPQPQNEQQNEQQFGSQENPLTGNSKPAILTLADLAQAKSDPSLDPSFDARIDQEIDAWVRQIRQEEQQEEEQSHAGFEKAVVSATHIASVESGLTGNAPSEDPFLQTLPNSDKPLDNPPEFIEALLNDIQQAQPSLAPQRRSEQNTQPGLAQDLGQGHPREPQTPGRQTFEKQAPEHQSYGHQSFEHQSFEHQSFEQRGTEQIEPTTGFDPFAIESNSGLDIDSANDSALATPLTNPDEECFNPNTLSAQAARTDPQDEPLSTLYSDPREQSETRLDPDHYRVALSNNPQCSQTGHLFHEVLALLQAYFVRTGAWFDLDLMLTMHPVKRPLWTAEILVGAMQMDELIKEQVMDNQLLEFLQQEAIRRQNEYKSDLEEIQGRG